MPSTPPPLNPFPAVLHIQEIHNQCTVTLLIVSPLSERCLSVISDTCPPHRYIMKVLYTLLTTTT